MKTKIGGQAIIEGVMMITPNSWGLAVRKEDGEIESRSWLRKSLLTKNKFLKLPFIRGFITLVEMMFLGFKAIDLSSQIALNEEKKTWKDNMILLLSVVVVLFLFFLLPFWAMKKFFPGIYDNNQGVLNLIIGFVRMSLFTIYIALISLSKEIKRIFQYHGAEHKVIHCYESDLELTVENASKFNKEHPRCGTSLILVTLIFAILIASITDTILFNVLKIENNPFLRTFIHILLIPFIAGSAYEFNRLGFKFKKNPFFRLLILPGLLFQKLTTRNPDTSQLEVSIEAVNKSMKIINTDEDDNTKII